MRLATALSDRLYARLDWFIPARLKTEAETLRRVRMFMISHLFGPFLGLTISLSVLALQGHPTLAWWLLIGSITGFWLLPIALKLGVPYQALALLSVQNLIFTILWGCYQYGGLNSPLMPWVITVPLLAFFYLGAARGTQIAILTMIAADLIIFVVLSHGGTSFPENVELTQLSSLGLISMICAAAYVSMMALYYASIVSSQSELEREVARRLETAEELREATRKADQANRAKSEFLAKMSHELRTPLNAIIGYSTMLLEDAETEAREQRCRDLTKIRDAGQHLLGLINDLLELSKLDAGKMQLYIEPLEVAAFLSEIAVSTEPLMAARGNTLEVDCPADIGTIEADGSRIDNAIRNLLSNAAKFTTNGRVTLSARREGDWLSIAVRDTGVGIDHRRLATLFENFDEDEHATTSTYGGTGLGLALSRKLCRLMGGDLSVTSKIGTGSCFTVRLPLAPREQSTADTAATARSDVDQSHPSAAGSVLVIDDDSAVLDLLQRVLTREGYEVSVAASGFEGIELARKAPPALILLDLHMPELSGWQVLRTLRSDKLLARCPVVLLTVEDDLQQGRVLGAQAHLVKPLQVTELLETISRTLRPETTAGAALAGASAAMAA